MFADKILVNRRNVSGEVSKKADACKQFFLLEVKSRIVAAVLMELQIQSLQATPDETILPGNLCAKSNSERRRYMETLCTKVIEKYILDRERITKFLQQREYEDWKKTCNPIAEGGRYKCRDESCSKTFRHDGKQRIEHDKTHGFHSVQDQTSANKDSSKEDDMYNYQIAFLEFGMIVMNYLDAVSEGDGLRVFRSWKYILSYLREDRAASRKYALEALYLILQRYALLSPADAHSLLWNRFHKHKFGYGGNIPLDLQLEHFNNSIKTILKKLGSNSTNQRAVDRLTKALTVNKVILDNFDNLCSIIKRSGKHPSTKTVSSDLEKLVNEMMRNNAMELNPGRRYEHFKHFSNSLLSKFNVHSFYKWIDDHKKNIILQNIAR